MAAPICPPASPSPPPTVVGPHPTPVGWRPTPPESISSPTSPAPLSLLLPALAKRPLLHCHHPRPHARAAPPSPTCAAFFPTDQPGWRNCAADGRSTFTTRRHHRLRQHHTVSFVLRRLPSSNRASFTFATQPPRDLEANPALTEDPCFSSHPPSTTRSGSTPSSPPPGMQPGWLRLRSLAPTPSAAIRVTLNPRRHSTAAAPVGRALAASPDPDLLFPRLHLPLPTPSSSTPPCAGAAVPTELLTPTYFASHHYATLAAPLQHHPRRAAPRSHSRHSTRRRPLNYYDAPRRPSASKDATSGSGGSDPIRREAPVPSAKTLRDNQGGTASPCCRRSIAPQRSLLTIMMIC